METKKQKGGAKMKINTLAACTLVATLLTAGACTAVDAQKAGNPDQPTKEIAIRNSEEFNQNQHIQKQVEIAMGDALLVTLFSNGTTGFSWDENARIADSGILQQMTHQNIAADSNNLGAPGAEQWTFKSLKAGMANVHLEYSRPWAGGEKGLWTVDLTVTVR
jgi:predicted secreted protein